VEREGKAITSLSAEPNMDYCRICKMGLANVSQSILRNLAVSLDVM
jgi:hypothetical protein